MRLCRRQDKLDKGRRLFQGFQERIEGILGDLVNFINDINFKSALGRLVPDVLDNLSNLVDAAIGGAIDLLEIARNSFFSL